MARVKRVKTVAIMAISAVMSITSPAAAITVIDPVKIAATEKMADLSDLGSTDDLSANGSANPFVALIAAIPEPASWALLVGGFVLIGGVARRKRHFVTS